MGDILFAGILPRHGEQTPSGRFEGHMKYKVNIKSFSSPFLKHVLLLILLVLRVRHFEISSTVKRKTTIFTYQAFSTATLR